MIQKHSVADYPHSPAAHSELPLAYNVLNLATVAALARTVDYNHPQVFAPVHCVRFRLIRRLPAIQLVALNLMALYRECVLLVHARCWTSTSEVKTL